MLWFLYTYVYVIIVSGFFQTRLVAHLIKTSFILIHSHAIKNDPSGGPELIICFVDRNNSKAIRCTPNLEGIQGIRPFKRGIQSNKNPLLLLLSSTFLKLFQICFKPLVVYGVPCIQYGNNVDCKMYITINNFEHKHKYIFVKSTL